MQTTVPIDAMVQPPMRLNARINKRGAKQRSYYRVRQIGRSGLMVASTGTFNANVTAGDHLEITVKSNDSAFECFGTVVHVTQTDPKRPYHVMTLEFTAGGDLDKLMSACKLEP